MLARPRALTEEGRQSTPCVSAVTGGDLFSVYPKLTPAQYDRVSSSVSRSTRRPRIFRPRRSAGPGFRDGAGLLPCSHRRSTGSLTAKQIPNQIAVLNKNFSGSGTGFGFTLAGVTRTDNAAWFYAGPGGTDEHSMKQALQQGGNNALNLYSTTAGSYLGWAYLPDVTTKPGQADLDGIVFNWETVPGASTTWAGRYDLGKDRHPRGRSLAEPRAHLLRGLQREGRLRRRHAAGEDADLRLPRRKGHLLRAGARPGSQPHGLLLRQLLPEFTPGQTQRMRDAWLFYRA